ncbi:MAG: peroxidase family protein, partial [Actinomycetota bacterium]
MWRTLRARSRAEWGLGSRGRARRAARVGLVVSLCSALIAGNVGIGPVAQAAAPVGAGFNLNPSDLKFILRQIKIAEAHARTATPANPCGTLLGTGPNQIPNTGNQAEELPFGLRTVDGTCNNLMPGQGRFGAADSVFPRMTTPRFRNAEAGDPDGPGPAPSGPTSYAQTNGTVIDSEPRVISNLIVDQSKSNPAAVAAAGEGAAPDASGTLSIPNVAPDVGLSAPFNSMFTFFGQFFDHGLDLVTKGGGTVLVPLKADDPLIVGADGVAGTSDDPSNPPPPGLRFMAVTRATNQPGPDGIVGDNPDTARDESADDVQEHTNTTTPFVDQNQTYTSHPSHQVFLREYELNAAGKPVSNGKLLDGAGGNIGNWAQVKAQAANLLGIDLADTDMLNVPLLKTDPYGRFERGPNGYPQIMRPGGGLLEGDPAANGGKGVSVPANALRTGHAFLDDIAHHAVPIGDLDHNPGTPPTPLSPDDGPGTVDDRNPGTYDDEMLDAHFITGDGRGNENIALTAVHTIFHSEHNRLVGHIKDVLTTEDPASLPDWQLSSGIWNGERLFQAARFVTEMEYQHLVFEEFARKVQPMVNAFTGYDTNIDPAIVAEFAHTVYRFGHSMLTETLARRNANGSNTGMPLLGAFLNPPAFNAAGNSSAESAAGSIVRGMTRQVGNEIDEFVTNALRNQLLGLPLDLASINMARAREAGIPRLNAARRQFFAESDDPAVAPYQSWADFGGNLKHPESLVNFIAA